MSETPELIPGLSVSYQEVDEELDRISKRRNRTRDPRICACGHPMGRHTPLRDGNDFCKPSKLDCPCRKADAVAEVEDTRMFLFATEGPGRKHALLRGISRSAAAGKSITWINDEPKCKICETREGLDIYPVSPNGRIMNGPGKMNGFLCEDCVAKIRGQE